MMRIPRLAHDAALRRYTCPQNPWHLPHAAWASSLSSIHRGIHRGNRSGRTYPDRRPGPVAYSGEQIRAAIVDENVELPGRQTRRKRFNDPETSFGKKSMVYRIKYGDMKDQASSILAQKEQEQVALRGDRNDGTERSRTPPRRDNEGRGEFAPEDRGRNAEPWRNEGASGRNSQPRRRSDDAPGRNAQPWRNDGGQGRNAQPWRNDGGRNDGGQGRNTQPWRNDGERRGRADYSNSGTRSRNAPEPRTRDFERRSEERAPAFGHRDFAPREDRPPRERDAGRRGDYGAREGEGRGSTPWQDFAVRHDGDADMQKRGPKKRPHPISLNRATAASQFLFGLSVVNSALARGRRKFYRLYILEGGKREQEGGRRSPRILAEQRGVQVTVVPAADGARMDKMSLGRPHNGYVLEASPLPQVPVMALGPISANPWKHKLEVVLGRQSREDEVINGTDTSIDYQPYRQQKPLVLLLNEILDPVNLGALIRSASFLGASAVAITTQGSATLTAVALKASSGAAEEIPIFTVESAVDFVKASKAAGWHCYAAAPPNTKNDKKRMTLAKVGDQNPLAKDPCIVILGSEGKGLPGPLRQAADFELAVPGSFSACVDSLNVSVAGGILLNAFLNPHSAARPAKETPFQALESASEPQEEGEEAEQTEAEEVEADGEETEEKQTGEKQTNKPVEEGIF